jgi:exoribonuclease R
MIAILDKKYITFKNNINLKTIIKCKVNFKIMIPRKPWRIYIDDRNYVSWRLYDLDTKEEASFDIVENFKINPVEKKLFNNDIIFETGDLVYSYLRDCPSLAGVLLLENSKTYGRTENKKRLLYKCIPDDKRIPSFLVPYDMRLGFSKNIKNKYVVFKFDSWLGTHPNGVLLEVLGDVDNLEAFYEYKLYCRNLNISNKEFNKKTHKLFQPDKTEEYVQKILQNPQFKIEDRTKEYIFTIDPKNSTDFDDGFSIKTTPQQTTIISIYIANVFFWMESFDLWSSFTKRVSTIYLPDRRRPMLPTILSDNLCSLLQEQSRFAFCMDLEYSENNELMNITFSNVLIRVKKNFVYEESALLKNKYYQELFQKTQKIQSKTENSHDVVSYWMIYMNTKCGEYMFENKIGIYRSVFSNGSLNESAINIIDKDPKIDIETKRFLHNWNSISGQYIVFSEDVNIEHELMNLPSYVHITSPIRRLVDLLNQILFFSHFSLIKILSPSGQEFLKGWLSEIEFINERMKSTTKIERECEIIRKCLSNPDILEKYHEAYIIDIRELKQDDYSCQYKYLLYLEKERIILTMKSEQKKDMYNKYKVKLYKIESYGVASKIKVGFYSENLK